MSEATKAEKAFSPDWAGYRQGLEDGKKDAADDLAALAKALAAMEQALAYADSVESDGYAESWLDTKTRARVSWSDVRRSISHVRARLELPRT